MESFDQIVEEIKHTLEEKEELSDIVFVNSFRSASKPNPIKKVYVTIGICGVELLGGAFGNYFGRANNSEIFGKNCCVSVAIRIYSPKTESGNLCSETFSRISSALIEDSSIKYINKISCKEVAFDKSSDAFFLDCTLKLNAFMGSSDEGIEISDIVVEGAV